MVLTRGGLIRALGFFRWGIKGILRRDTKSHKLHIFLCHSSDDKPIVREIYKRLRTDRFEPWLDEVDLLGGQKWRQEIPKAVRNSDVIIVCLSRNSVSKRGYVQKEIKLALDVADEQPEGTIFLIPLKLEECELPEQLKCWQCVNFYDEDGYERLGKSLQHRATTLKKKLQPSADIAHHSTLTPQKVLEPKSYNNQLFEQGLKAYRPVSLTSLWIFITALLILLLVTKLLLPNPPSPAPTLGLLLRQDGVVIWNTNDYPIVSLKANLTAYKIDKKQRRIIGDKLPEVNIPVPFPDQVPPANPTNIQTPDLMTPVKSTQFGAPPNPDEIIVWVLKVTFSPGIYVIRNGKRGVESNGEGILRIKPFLIKDIDGRREVFPVESEKDIIFVDEVAYRLPDVMQ